ncbi:MAG: double-strand break repair helicase AddA [Alphaproteobacteria bacterium]|nr:double-strand break repair helicase AddA [Alphaproteobacteria bacterium]
MTQTALHPASPSLTPRDYQRAASAPDASVWVNASAGSGKTTVLTARVTRLLLAGVPPEKILCLTYTRAGAAEMTNRITETFSRWVSCDDAVLETDLIDLQDTALAPGQMAKARRLFASVLACPGGLRIRTIHSFCQEILSRFPIEAGLPPHFTLIEDYDLDALRDNVIDDLLRDATAEPDTPVARALGVLIAEQGEHGFGKVLKDILKECARLTATPEILAARMRAQLDLGPDDTADRFRADAMAKIPETRMRQMAAWLAADSDAQKKRAATLQGIIDTPPLQRAARFADYCRLFLTQKNEPLAESKIAGKSTRTAHPEIIDIAGREAARLVSVLERIESATIALHTESVLVFGREAARRLAAAKRARAALDYDDLIRRAEELLTRPDIGPWILYKLDQGIDHILVDEAQDTSDAQWNIVRALTEEFHAGTGARSGVTRTLFVVGDEKQSIFSFQGANPDGFLSLRDFFTRTFAAAGQDLKKIPLHTSFRSAPAILAAVDAVFAPDAARQGVSQEAVTHFPHANRDGSEKTGRVELWPLIEPDKNDGDADPWEMPVDYEEERDPQAELAQRIASKIKGWLTRRETLPGMNAPVRASDVMILLRRRGRFADLMVRALKLAGVPVTGIDRMRLMQQLPVMDLLALVRFVLLPEDDLNLAALLRSPIIGLGEEQLMELAIGRTTSLWQRVRDVSAFAAVRDYLAARLGEADYTTPFDFLSRALALPCPGDAGGGRRALWQRLGDEAIDPIDELLTAAQNFGRAHAPSLQNFLHWLVQSDAEIKREMDSGKTDGADDEGRVRIMTVHASKGLEAPIVFLPDTAATPRSADMPKFQWHDGAPFFLARQPSFGVAARVWAAARQRQMQEYRRLFYVALTRAATRLYICGWRGRNDVPGSWYDLAAAALRPLHRAYIPAEDDYADVIFADAEIAPAVAVEKEQAGLAPVPPLPAWAYQAAVKPAAPAAPPSRGDVSAATPDAAFARGRIIHRLLQSLPDIAPGQRAAAAARFLSQPRHNLTDEDRREITAEVAALLDTAAFAALFAPDSRAEVALAGTIDGVDMFRQVDRLCVRDNEVWIVDYKTNRPPPLDEAGIPDAYRRQMAEYRALLRGVYPGKAVRCFLLWTYTARLMEITG